MKERRLRPGGGKQTDTICDIPDGIIVHLTKECGGNVHDAKVIDVTCGSFEKETYGANPHSGAYQDDPRNAAKNVADLEAGSCFFSAYRDLSEYIPQTKNNWLCYDFKERRILSTPYAIRTNALPVDPHLKSWLLEISPTLTVLIFFLSKSSTHPSAHIPM
jgi:hypothetical protein